MSKPQAVNYKAIALIAIIGNLPIYLLFYLFGLSLDIAFIAQLALILLTPVFLVPISYWLLKRYISNPSFNYGLKYGFWLSLFTFVLDLSFFGLYQGYGLSYLKPYVAMLYLEIIIAVATSGYLAGKGKEDL